MNTDAHKSTPQQIRARFDADVERFSNLDTGQQAQMDAPRMMRLVAECAAASCAVPKAVLDLGSGAGNYTLKLLQQYANRPGFAPPQVTLVDLSRPMLDRAAERLEQAHPGMAIETIHGDIRDFAAEPDTFDLALAAQCLHHLRGDEEWDHVFGLLHRSLKPAGSLWIADSVEHDHAAVRGRMRDEWARYLTDFRDEAYRDHVLAYVEKEDSPRPMVWQLDRLRAAGFASVEVLHAVTRFAAFAAFKASPTQEH